MRRLRPSYRPALSAELNTEGYAVRVNRTARIAKSNYDQGHAQLGGEAAGEGIYFQRLPADSQAF